MSDYYSTRVVRMIKLLKAAGYDPKYFGSSCPDVEDDEIILTDKVRVQVSSSSGDAVSVNRAEGECVRFFPVNNESELLPAVRKAMGLVTR